MLKAEHFFTLGKHGLGNPRSAVAQSMAYFKGHVYLGVTHPKGDTSEDAARILRYDIAKGCWEEMHRSPLIDADPKVTVRDLSLPSEFSGMMNAVRPRGTPGKVPLYRGYRCMTVFKDVVTDVPALYASTLSHWGSQLLRSTDGETFATISEPGLGNSEVLSFRMLVPFGDRLFIAPAGSVDSEVMDRNFGEIATLYVSEDPVSGKWQPAIPPGFGDENNKSIFALCVFNDCLYAGTGNPERGFQIWKSRAKGVPPYEWMQVIMDGAGRYNLNESVTTMVVFKDGLYVGSGLPGLGYDKANDVGPAAAELIRINPDDSWDLIIGSPRFTPTGLKVPFSACGPGIDDPYNSVFWSMAVHDGALYVGTHHWKSWEIALSGGAVMEGGYQLWATEDAENWTLIVADGFGNPFSHGVRTLLSTPYGLFLGTATHREIEKFWLRRIGRTNQVPEIGGLEVWCGVND